jgi:hypothetical protein
MVLLAAPDTYAGAITVPLHYADILNQGEIKVYANLNTPADPVGGSLCRDTVDFFLAPMDS